METETNLVLPESVEKEATQHINSALALLKPYLLALSPADRQAIPKMSDGTQPFVEKTIAYCESMPHFIPQYLNATVLTNNMALYYQLIPLLRVVKQLNNGLDDTAMKAGAECYAFSLNYYNSVKQASRMDIPGAKAIVEDLRKRFTKTKNDEAESEE